MVPIETVLRIYEHRCAICGYGAMLGSTDLGLEAAHIRWHAAGGTDTPDNGLALCSLHHKALDRGAIGLDESLRLLVSQYLRRAPGAEEWLLRFAGEPISNPITPDARPSTKHTHWHLREVFKAPARPIE